MNCFNVNSLFDESSGIVGINKSILVADNYANVCRLQASNWCNYKPQLTNEGNFYRVNRGSFGWIGRNASFPLMKTLLGSSFFFTILRLSVCCLRYHVTPQMKQTGWEEKEMNCSHLWKSLKNISQRWVVSVSGKNGILCKGFFPSQIEIGAHEAFLRRS